MRLNYIVMKTKSYLGQIAAFCVCLMVCASSVAHPQTKQWRKIRGKPLTVFGFECTTPSSYPSKRLSKLVAIKMRKHKDGGMAWGDRAFAFDLNSDQALEYFVPLRRGATATCIWAVFAENPTRFLGELSGNYIYVYKGTGTWPITITYTHMSASEGILATYVYKNGRYSWLRDEYPTSVGMFPGNDIPKFLKKARAACQLEGYPSVTDR
jgi:hypothetical protein